MYDCLVIVAIASTAAILGEVVTHKMVYGKDAYRTLVRQTLRIYNDLVKRRAELAVMEPKREDKHKRRLQAVEKEFKLCQKKLYEFTTRANLCVAVVLIVLYFKLQSSYAEIPVLKLPFEPIGFIQKVTHRGLQGDDATEASVRFLGHVSPRGLPDNSFAAMTQEAIEQAEKTM